MNPTSREEDTRMAGDDTATGVEASSIVENTKVTSSEELGCDVVTSAKELEAIVLDGLGAWIAVGVGEISVAVNGRGD